MWSFKKKGHYDDSKYTNYFADTESNVAEK
jgi:hypothetical protein